MVMQAHTHSYLVQEVARPGIGMNVYGHASPFVLQDHAQGTMWMQSGGYMCMPHSNVSNLCLSKCDQNIQPAGGMKINWIKFTEEACIKCRKRFLARATSLYNPFCPRLCASPCTCMCLSLCNKFLRDVARRRILLYNAVQLVLIAPLNSWQNSTPFWCEASICTVKIDHFGTLNHVARAYSILVVLVFRRVLKHLVL